MKPVPILVLYFYSSLVVISYWPVASFSTFLLAFSLFCDKLYLWVLASSPHSVLCERT